MSMIAIAQFVASSPLRKTPTNAGDELDKNTINCRSPQWEGELTPFRGL